MESTVEAINELTFADYNPREITKHDFEALKQSIREFGFVEPVVINKDKTIVGGHMRVRAAKDLGMTEVPVIVVDLSKEREKALNLALNRISGQWDEQRLAELIYQLRDLPEIQLTGFDKIEISHILDTVSGVKEDEFDAQKEYDKITEPIAKYGDVWQLGRHRLMCGDATKEEDVLKLMDGKKANLIFTDPPYNVDYLSQAGHGYSEGRFDKGKGKIFNDDKTDQEALEFYTKTLENLRKVADPYCAIYWWFANANNWINRMAFEQSGWRMSQIIIWLKNSIVFSRGQDYHRCYEPCMLGWQKGKHHFTNKKIANLSDVFSVDYHQFQDQLDVWFEHRDSTIKYLHPTQKPIRLAERALRKSSQQGGVVVDLFGGSGSTLIACEQMERACYMMELDPKYVDVIVKRWEQFTGQKAVKL